MQSNKNVLTIRIPEDLKQRLEKTAKKQGVSMNQFALYAFTKSLSDLETNEHFKTYLKNKSPEEILSNFDNVMKKVKKKKTPDWDKIL